MTLLRAHNYRAGRAGAGTQVEIGTIHLFFQPGCNLCGGGMGWVGSSQPRGEYADTEAAGELG